MSENSRSLPPLKLGGSVAASFDGTSGARRSGSQEAPGSRSNNRLYNSVDSGYQRGRRESRVPFPGRGSNGKFPSLRSRPPSDSTAFSSTSEAKVPRYIPPFLASPQSEQTGFIKRSSSEECLKCMLKIPHDRCEAHKYLRIGGGYRHSYWMVKAMLEEIELQRQKELLIQQRLEAIQEKQIHVIKTMIRTKSGRLVERLIYMSEEDYQNFLLSGEKGAEEILKKYLSKEEGNNLVSFDREEQKAITTWIRTKSGRRVAQTVYVSKSEYDAIKSGAVDANSILKKYVKMEEGETLDGWGEAEMKTIKTWVRTKSGRLVEKTILVSKEDYERLEKIKAEGGDPSEIFGKYMSLDEGTKIESWEKQKKEAMKVVKTMVRTKSGRLVEKTILMTEEEFKQFQESGGDVKFLRKFLDLDKDDVIEGWEKASTVYSASDDEEVATAKPGTRIIGKDGKEYEVYVDPITGKKYKREIKPKGKGTGKGPPKDKGPNLKGVKAGRVAGMGPSDKDPNEKGMTVEQVKAYRAGKRRDGSASEFSYKSVISAGGTRHVKRRRRRADGTYSDEESYHSDQDEEGKKRRQKRRTERKAAAHKAAKEKYAKGGRNGDSDSDFSYRSVISAGGTRHVKRRKKNKDGTYGDEESYHSSQDEDGQARRKQRRDKRMKKLRDGGRNAGSDSDFSYRSVISAGGTRHVKRRKKNKDGTYGDEESYHSSQDEDGKERRKKRRQGKVAAMKQGKRNPGSDSDYSYRSVVSAGGTRHVKRKKRNADGTYGDEESYHSSQDEDGQKRRRQRRRDRKHAGSAHSYYSVVSEGGTRHVKRKKKNADGTYGDSESYHSGDSELFEKKKKYKKKRHEHGSGSEYSYTSEVSAGGTRHRTRRQRIRDAEGRVIGYGKKEAYTSPSEYETDSNASYYTYVSDGKGGKKRVKVKGKGAKDGKGKKKGGGPDGNMTDFSDSLLSTDSENEPDLSKMTEAERKKYLEDKAKRKAEREKKRKEKYGDKYEEMMEKHQKAKAAKSMVSYQKNRRASQEQWDDRGIGLAHKSWGDKKKKKDGHEADDESDDGDDVMKGRKKKDRKGSDSEEEVFEMGEDGQLRKVMRKKGDRAKDDDEESIYEYVRDAEGNIVMGKDGKPLMKKVGVISKALKAMKAGADGVVMEDGEFVYKLDKYGNLMKLKKGQKVHDPDEDSDGDYFETLADGTVVLKKGKRKIDINKLSADDLRKLGIDPNLSKQEIAKKLKEMFGDEIRIEKGGQKVGVKGLDAYSDANTDDLADDSDLDVSTLKGQKRVRVLMKRGGPQLQEHMRKMIEQSRVVDEGFQHPAERDATIDYVNHYRLVDHGKVDIYARAFVVEDENLDCVLDAEETRLALGSVPAIQSIGEKQLDYVLKLLDIDNETDITFRMFSVVTALAERVTMMDTYCKNLLEISNLIDIERKMKLYKELFYCNAEGDRNPNYIQADSLKIDLMAGGLNWSQQEYIMELMKPNEWNEVSFLDYLAYIPLFMSMHDKMVDNPLDMSNAKYEAARIPSGSNRQRDINPLGHPLQKDSLFLTRQQRARELADKANNIVAGKNIDAIRAESLDVFNKYQKLPNIGATMNPTPKKKSGFL